MKSCTPWPAAVTAILNAPTNLIGIDIVLNHLKTLVLVENGSSDWSLRPDFYYTGLFNYLTLIRPNYMATAQAIDTLIGQISGSSNITNNVFAEWAAERFDNATTLVAMHAP